MNERLKRQLAERRERHDRAVEAVNRAANAAENSAATAGMTELAEIREELRSATENAKRAKESLQEIEDIAAARQFTPGGGSAGGEALTELRSDQSVTDYLRTRGGGSLETEPLALGKFLRGMATGNWQNAEAEKRALAEGSVGAGGAMVPTVLAGQLIDAARAQSVVLRAGAMTVPLESKTTKYARLTGDPSGEWHTENAALNDEDMTFDTVDFDAKTATVLVKASLEVVEDAINLDQVVTSTFAKILALKMDAAALSGSGGTAPTGLTNLGLSDAILPNPLVDYDIFLDAIGAVRLENFEPNAMISHPATLTEASKLKDTTNQPLEVPDDVKALTLLPTTQLGSRYVIVGQWNELLWGVRTSIKIEVFREALLDNLQIAFLAYVRCDFKVAHNEAFYLLDGYSS